jgi:uracil-DNA glycosylase
VTRPARTPTEVSRQAAGAADLAVLDLAVADCRACPRLVAWRERVARERRAAYRDQEYWGRAVPGFGDPAASVLVVGLAPGAHGANRTGRMFTGDRSGDWLYGSMHRVGLASQPTSTSRDDGLHLTGARVVAAVRCAPPDNRPTPAERDCCAPWLDRELALLAPTVRVVVALGGFAWQSVWAALGRAGVLVPRPRPAFGHGAEVRSGEVTVLGCYHPSQQNTFTGRLTEPMLDAVLGRAAHLAGLT